MSDFTQALDRANAPDLAPVDGVTFLAENLPPFDWIIPDFMARNFQGALYGKSKSQKTYFAMQLGLSVACGVKCLGFPAPERPRRVAYFNLELLPTGYQERMRAQTDALGVKLKSGRFLVYNLRGRASDLREVFTDADGNPVTDNALTRQLRERGVDLAIIDPRYKLMQGTEDENSAAGLRALLDFRAALADVCAVILVGHDPKGDVSNKSLLDRGAGSYTAMADDDCTILLSPNGYASNAVTVETVSRYRAPVPPFAALFDGATQTFTLDPHIPVETAHGKTAQGMTPAERAQKNADREAAFKSAALAVAESAGERLLGKQAFKSELAKRPEAAIGSNLADDLLRALVERGDLAETPELERKPDGTAKARFHGARFISTPERIAAYCESFGAQTL